jgi:transcriptional regulator with XRE-family HTH domain
MMNLSQEEFAFESNMHPATISLYERGLRAPTLYTVFLLAKVLKTTPQELIAQVAARNPEEDKNGELVKK